MRYQVLCRSAVILALALTAEVYAQAQSDADAQAAHQFLEMLKRADANRDGQSSEQELNDFLSARFSKIDRNGDGLANAADAPKHAQDRFLNAVNPLIARFDENGDDSVSFNEFVSRPVSGFAQLDFDEDGLVDIAEAAKFTGVDIDR